MHEDAKGRTLFEGERVVSDGTLGGLSKAIGTDSGGDTARLVTFFGPTVGGEETVVDGLSLDLSRALLAGQAYEFRRPFEPGETVQVRVFVEDVFTKGANQFGIIVAEFSSPSGDLIQRQSTTFIERGAS